MTDKDTNPECKPTSFPVFPTNRLRHVRTVRGLTQKELARRAGTSQVTISQLERGQVLQVGKEIQAGISLALGINRYWLFDENGRLRP